MKSISFSICRVLTLGYFVLSLSLGCSEQPKERISKKVNSPVVSQQVNKLVEFQSVEEEQDFIDNLKLVCEDCNPSTGLATIRNTKGVSLCAGVFLDGSHFVTNKHCIPPELQVIGKDCSKDVKIYAKAEETLKSSCASVQFLSPQKADTNFIKPDYVVLSLVETLKGIPLLDSFAGDLNDGDIIQANRPDYSRIDLGEISFRTSDCRITKNSIINPYYMTHSSSATFSVSECQFLPGQSGSPLYHEGKLFGIHSQSLIVSPDSEFFKFNTETPVDSARGTLHLCFTPFITGKETPEVCRQQYSSDRELAQMLILKNKSYLPKNEERRNIISRWLEQNDDQLFYKFSSGQILPFDREERGIRDSMLTGIDCVRRNKIQTNIEQAQDILKWDTYIEYNKYMQVSFRIENQKIWSHFEVTESGGTEAAINLVNKEGEKIMSQHDFQIPWCGF